MLVLKQRIGDSSASLKKSEDIDGEYNGKRREDEGGVVDVWYNYTSSTTLHCLSRAAKVKSSLFRRFLWYIFLGSMIGLLFWQSSIQIARYLKLGTLLKEHSALDEQMHFPSITICDINLVQRSVVQDAQIQRVLSETYMANTKNKTYFQSLDVNWLKSIDINGIFYNRSHDVFDMFVICLWENKPIPCSSIFYKRVTSAGFCATLSNQELSENGGIGSGMGLTVILQSNTSDYLVTSRPGSGFRVLVHTEHEEPDVNELGLALAPGTANIISVKKYQTSFLRRPIPAFGDDFCLDTAASDYVNPLQYVTKYSVGACRLCCFTAFVEDMCGCKDVFMPGSGPICDIDQMVNCYDKTAILYASNSSCDCSQPCETVSFTTKLSQGSFPYPGYLEATFPDLNVSADYMKENGLMFEVFLEDKLFIRREQILEFTASDLVASVGGFMGLFIGASFGTVMELLECFFDFILKVFKKLTAKSQGGI